MRVATTIELDEQTERELRVLSKGRRVEARLLQRAHVQGISALLSTIEDGLSTFPVAEANGTLQDIALTSTGTSTWLLSPKSEP